MNRKKSILKTREYLIGTGLVVLLASFLSWLLIPALGIAQIIYPITDNSYDDLYPQINDNGYVVWQEWDGSDWEIFLYNGTTITQLTNNSYDDGYPQINKSGYVVWQEWDGEDYEIFLYDGTTTKQITHNSYDDGYPQINKNGYVVWQEWDGSDSEIFLYNGTTTIQLTNNSYGDYYPQISDNGYVVWSGYDGSDYEIFLYNGTTTTQLTNNSYDDGYPQINNNGYVVWQGWDDSDLEIFLYDGTTTTQLTNNSDGDYGPQINDNGYVVWQGYDGSDYEIFLYDGNTTIQLTNNSDADHLPQINDNGYVVWTGYDGSDYEIFVYNGTTTIQLTNNSYDDYDAPQINDNGHVVWAGYDGSDDEIFFYSPSDCDGDGVADDSDNCKFVYNPNQEDVDNDTVGDVCDNCPQVSNPDQTDTDGDHTGDACEDLTETITPASVSASPGKPLWITATFNNGTGQDIQTIRPDCYDTVFTVTDTVTGRILPPRCRQRFAYGIPTDVTTIKTGENFSVTCDLSEIYDQDILIGGTYNVTATYSNYIQDPDYHPDTGACDLVPCYNLWMGAVSSTTPSTVTITGSAVVKKQADIAFNPSKWDVQWASGGSPTISAQISNIKDHRVSEVDPNTILLNGTVSIVPGSKNIVDDVLTVQFDRSEAVKSLGTVENGMTVYPTIQGGFFNFVSTDILYGHGRVEIYASNTGTLIVTANKHIVGQGSYPGSNKTPIVGMETRVYSKASGSCAAGYGISWQHYPEIWANCEEAAKGSTDNSGKVTFNLAPGDYLVIGQYIEGTKTLYIGVSVGEITAGSVVEKYLQVIENAQGKILPGKYQKLTGSALLIIEPEYVEWSETGTVELYPFVFESIGDWTVNVSVSPPEGFVADHSSLETEVNTDLKSVQFTITDVGTKWKPTNVKYRVKHKGAVKNIHSKIGIKLAPNLAKKLGLSEYGE